MCEVWDAVVKRRNREDFGRFELVDHVHKFLHNVPLADRSFSGMGHVLRHAMCRAAHGEGAGETRPSRRHVCKAFKIVVLRVNAVAHSI